MGSVGNGAGGAVRVGAAPAAGGTGGLNNKTQINVMHRAMTEILVASSITLRNCDGLLGGCIDIS
jgi:hypothetical protein